MVARKRKGEDDSIISNFTSGQIATEIGNIEEEIRSGENQNQNVLFLATQPSGSVQYRCIQSGV